MNIQPSIDLKKVNLQTAVGYLVSLHENEYQWNLLGVKVIGVAATEADIPHGTYEYGDAYEIGTEPPYDLYIYTRPDGKVHTEGYWFNTGKFPMPGPQGPKGDGLEQVNKWTNGTVGNVTYNTTDGAKVTQTTTVDYTDSTDGSTKQQQFDTTTTLPIVPGKYISMNATSDNKKMEVKVDDTALALDYYKFDKSYSYPVIPAWSGSSQMAVVFTDAPTPYSLVQRDVNGNGHLNALYTILLVDRDAPYRQATMNEVYRTCRTAGTDQIFEKTPTDTGTMSADLLAVFTGTPNSHIIYDNQLYYRIDPTNAPNGTLNFIHIDSIDDGNGGYKATGKCFSITVSTRAWQVVDLDFGGSTRTTHNLTLTNSSTGTNIYFSLTNNRTETYEGAPAGLLSALENSSIACTVDANGTYSAGMITTDGVNFQVTYGNGEQLMIDQGQVSIADNMV